MGHFKIGQSRGDTEHSMERLSRQIGTSVAILRATCVHVQFTHAGGEHIHELGARPEEAS